MNDSLQIHSIHLRVADLARSREFYIDRLGFIATSSSTAHAALAVARGAPPLLFLTEDRSARPAPRDAAGLFHAALLLPSRAALGGWLRHTAFGGTEFTGFADHGVSEALYLDDPDGNGLEFYSDRPRDHWPRHNGELAMVTDPLALPDLLAHAALSSPPLAGARWGHLHLRVTDLERSTAFYSATFGVSLTQHYGTSARFLGADDYHHHFGLNTWGGVARAQPAGALGLVEASVASRTVVAERHLSDPDGIPFHVLPLDAMPAHAGHEASLKELRR